MENYRGSNIQVLEREISKLVAEKHELALVVEELKKKNKISIREEIKSAVSRFNSIFVRDGIMTPLSYFLFFAFSVSFSFAFLAYILGVSLYFGFVFSLPIVGVASLLFFLFFSRKK